MKTILRAYYSKPLVICLITSLLALTISSGSAEAMFLPSSTHPGLLDKDESTDRMAELAKIQAALESKVIQQKLSDYGLTSEEAMARINKLSDEQIHQFAKNTEALQAGGDGVEAVIGLVILAILVVVLIYLLQHRIEIK
jgi:hypothetical protein